MPVGICFLIGVGIYKYGNYKSSREYYQEGLKMVKKKDFYNASLYLEGALHYDNEYEEAYLLHAKIYVHQLKDYKYGLDIINTALAETNGNGILYYLKGYCIYKMIDGDKIGAIEYLEKAKQIKPEIDSIYYILGNLYHNHGIYDLSVTNINEAIKRFPQDSELYLLKGISLFRLSNNTEAIENLSKSISIKKSGEAFYFRGLAYKSSGNIIKACEDFANAISHDYEDAKIAEGRNCL